MSRNVSKSLHRLKNNQSDWDNIPDGELSFLQRIAKRTKGIVTVANAVTLMGAVAVMNGLFDYVNGQKAMGVTKIAAGRIADVGDGYLADWTGTKGIAGKAGDPVVDVVELCFALPMLVQADVLPIVPAITIAAQKVVDSAATISSQLRGKEMNATEEGKYSTAALWTGIGAFLLKGALGKHAPGYADTLLDVVGWGGTCGGSAYHVPATIEYSRVGFGSKNFE